MNAKVLRSIYIIKFLILKFDKFKSFNMIVLIKIRQLRSVLLQGIYHHSYVNWREAILQSSMTNDNHLCQKLQIISQSNYNDTTRFFLLH